MEPTPQVGVTVVPADTSGFVSRAELAAHIDPMKSDISEVKNDVKALLAAQNRRRGMDVVASGLGRAVVTVGSGAVGALLALVIH